ncbi:hypothetical protein BDQ17DRAFT_1326051 [Cyathus striatus]|nr:hypothetical protein BDQ17DRAFT_1326051 [Cyathus striatus]
MADELYAPFKDNSTSDITLVSSDKIHFHVHKIILSLASPLFNDMFTLPQPSPSSPSSSPTIQLTETSSTITSFLRLVYPIPDPELVDLVDIIPILEAATKYQLEEATLLARAALRRMVPKKPLEVKIEGSGRLTPWDWTAPGTCCIPELEDVSAGAVYRLMRFAKSGIDPGKFVHPESRQFQNKETVPPELWYDDGDVIVKSSDGFAFKVHQLVLQLISNTLLEHLSTKHEDAASPPTIDLPETGHVLVKLLRMCYLDALSPLDPSCEPHLSYAVREIAIKYSMHRVLLMAQQRWMEAANMHPLQSFFIAKSHEKLTMSKLLFRKGVPVESTYVPEMEDYPARDYFRLLRYYHRCKSKLVEVGSAFERKSGEYWDESTSSWWRSTKGTEIVGIGLPIIQRELRRNNAVVDLGKLVKESEDLNRNITEALDKVSFDN